MKRKAFVDLTQEIDESQETLTGDATTILDSDGDLRGKRIHIRIDEGPNACKVDVLNIVNLGGDFELRFVTSERLQDKYLLVNRQCLRLSSPIFENLLDPSPPFHGAAPSTSADNGIDRLFFRDHEYEAMKLLMHVIHLQNDVVPHAIPIERLQQVAKLCDEYDLKRALGLWPERWMGEYDMNTPLQNHGPWLFVSAVFQNAEIYGTITKALITNTKLSEGGELVLDNSKSSHEDVLAYTLGT